MHPGPDLIKETFSVKLRRSDWLLIFLTNQNSSKLALLIITLKSLFRIGSSLKLRKNLFIASDPAYINCLLFYLSSLIYLFCLSGNEQMFQIVFVDVRRRLWRDKNKARRRSIAKLISENIWTFLRRESDKNFDLRRSFRFATICLHDNFPCSPTTYNL